MNIKEAIAANNAAGKNGMAIEDAKQFWAKDQEKSLSDDQVKEKTYSGIKLVESIVSRDKLRKFIDDETMTLEFKTRLGEKTKKVAPYNLWINIKNADGEVVYSMTYKDFATGNALVLDKDGKELAAGKGWKKVRDYFRTEEEKPAKAEKPKVEKKEPPKKVKAARKAKKEVVVEEKATDEVVVGETTEGEATEEVVAEKVELNDWVEPQIPDIPEELQ